MVGSGIIILAVINGLSPTNTREKLDNAPPDSKFKIPPRSDCPSTGQKRMVLAGLHINRKYK